MNCQKIYSFLKPIITKGLFSLCCLSFLLVNSLKAQNALYVSKQSLQYSYFTGQASKTTDQFNKGIANVRVTGPIKANVTPNFSINPNESKTWDGKIIPDIRNIPDPGQLVKCSIIGDYDITFSRPDGTGGPLPKGAVIVGKKLVNNSGANGQSGVFQIINLKGTTNIPIDLYSISCSFTQFPTEVCPKKQFTVKAIGYPEGGEYLWGDGTVGQSHNFSISKDSILSVTYQIQGVTYKIKKSIKIGNSNPWVETENQNPNKPKLELEDKLSQLIYSLPGADKLTVEGPFVTTKFHTRGCCQDSSNIQAEKETYGMVTYKVKGSHINLNERPYVSNFVRHFNKFGYSYKVIGSYSTKMSINSDFQGKYRDRVSTCSTSCLSENADLSIPFNFNVSVKGVVLLKKLGSSKNSITQIPFDSKDINCSTKLIGKIYNNYPSCNSGLKYKAGFLESTLNIQVNPGSYNLTFPIQIAPGYDLIRNY